MVRVEPHPGVPPFGHLDFYKQTHMNETCVGV